MRPHSDGPPDQPIPAAQPSTGNIDGRPDQQQQRRTPRAAMHTRADDRRAQPTSG
jgi:hypothetical protein